jgi:hypothetical protein
MERDDRAVQRDRVARVAKAIEPGCRVDFTLDQDELIRFRVFHASGKALIERSGGWEAGRLANLSDGALVDLLRLLSVGRMG